MARESLAPQLDLLLLSALRSQPAHGYAVIEELWRRSEGTFDLPESTVYPALHRLELRGLLKAEWGTSENNRRAKFYRLTPLGRRMLRARTESWERLVSAVGKVLYAQTRPA